MTNQIAKKENGSITEQVLDRVINLENNNQIDIPENYSAANALQSAYLILSEPERKSGKSLLESCTNKSISKALLDMVIKGLNPSKDQCYFIKYGDTLTMQPSYLGTVAMTKRLEEVKDVKGYAIYEGDELELGFDPITGNKTIEKYKPNINRVKDNLIGAMALIIGHDEILHIEYMGINQIKQSWNQGTMSGKSPAHKNFPDQMAIKTVINRACKYYANTSSEDFKHDYIDTSMEDTDVEIEEDIKEHADKEIITVDAETGEVLDEVIDIEDIEAPF